MIRCPNCDVSIQLDNLNSCIGADCLPPKFGVHRLLKKEVVKRLLPFEERFSNIREQEGVRWKNTSIYERLPFVSKKEGNKLDIWKTLRTIKI